MITNLLRLTYINFWTIKVLVNFFGLDYKVFTIKKKVSQKYNELEFKIKLRIFFFITLYIKFWLRSM